MPTPVSSLTDAPELCALIDRPVVAHLSTVSPTGRPQSSVIWIERVGDELVAFADVDTAKVKNIRRNPNVVVIVVDAECERAPGVPIYARISGTAEIRDGEPDIPHRLARAYGNPDGYTFPLDHIWCNLHITVTRISGSGPHDGGPLGGWVDPAAAEPVQRESGS